MPPLRCSELDVVVVDDDESFRVGLATNLADDGHAVTAYADPADVPPDAIAAARVVVTDYQMADVDGLAFADAIHAKAPGTAIVLATAYWSVEIEAEIAARDYVRLCRKPLDYDELHDLVHGLVEETGR